MPKNLMDTMEFNEIKQMIGDTQMDDITPVPPVTDMGSGDFDLDNIIAEINNKKQPGKVNENRQKAVPQTYREQENLREAHEAHALKNDASQSEHERVADEPWEHETSKKKSWFSRKNKTEEHDFSITEQIELRKKQGTVAAPAKAQSRIRDITEEVEAQRAQKAAKAAGEQSRNAESVINTPPEPIKASERTEVNQNTSGIARQSTGKLHQTGRIRAKNGRNEIGNIELLDREELPAEELPDEENDEIQEKEELIRDPKLATRSCARRVKSLQGRSIFVFILFAASCYISFAGTFSWPIPDAISYIKTPYITLLTLIAVQVLSMFIAIDIVGMGLYYLFTLKPTYHSIVSVSLFASLVHSISIILFPEWGGYLPYTSVVMCTLFAAMMAEAHKFAGRQRTYKAATLTENPVGVYQHEDIKDAEIRAVKFRMEDLTDFLRQIEKPDYYDKIGRIYSPVAIVTSAALAVLATFGKGEPTRFLWAFSAILSVSAPLSLLTAFGLPYKNIARRLLADGAAIAGLNAAHRLQKAGEVALTDGDLFPAGTVIIEGLKVFGNHGTEKVLSYAAAVISGSGSDIGRIFAETLRERYGRPVKASNILHYESGGMSAEIFSDTVLVGTASFVMRMGIRVNEGKNIKNGVFVVINSEIAGIFALKYYASAQTYGSLHTFKRQKIKLVLATRDFSITPAMIESIFELKRGTVKSPEVNIRMEISNPEYAEGDEVCGILSRDGIAPFAECVHAAGKLSAAVVSNLIIGTFAGVCGMLLMFYLTYIFSPNAVVPYNVLFYLLLWYLPTFFISHNAKNGY